MKVFIFIAAFILLAFEGVQAQHLIGYDKTRVNEIVKTEMRGFRLDRSSVNPVFNYLKFVNSAGTRTLLVFFDSDDISTGVRLVSDYSELSIAKADFDKRYSKTGKDAWEYKDGEELFSVMIEEKEWYFVIDIKKKRKLGNGGILDGNKYLSDCFVSCVLIPFKQG